MSGYGRRRTRSSTQPKRNTDSLPVDPYVYENGEDDDDDDEPDYVPGTDEPDESQNSSSVLEGVLSTLISAVTSNGSSKDEALLSYQGSSFHLKSTSTELTWEADLKPLLGASEKEGGKQETSVVMSMSGPLELALPSADSPSRKAPHRQFQVTFSRATVKTTGLEENGSAQQLCEVHGKEIEDTSPYQELVEFRGSFETLHDAGPHSKLPLVCQVTVRPRNGGKAKTAAAAAAVSPPAAASSRKKRRVESDDESFDEEDDYLAEDEDEDADDVDHNELIALHEEAGLSVEELRKRIYGGNNGDAPSTPTQDPKPNGSIKRKDEDDDDDDYCF
jgi:hypothetical protein